MESIGNSSKQQEQLTKQTPAEKRMMIADLVSKILRDESWRPHPAGCRCKGCGRGENNKKILKWPEKEKQLLTTYEELQKIAPKVKTLPSAEMEKSRFYFFKENAPQFTNDPKGERAHWWLDWAKSLDIPMPLLVQISNLSLGGDYYHANPDTIENDVREKKVVNDFCTVCGSDPCPTKQTGSKWDDQAQNSSPDERRGGRGAYVETYGCARGGERIKSSF